MRPRLRPSAIAPRPIAGPLIAALLVVGLVGTLAGCGSNAPSGAGSTVADQPGSAAPSPSTDPAAGDPLAAFEGRLRDATAREGLLVRTLAAASTGSATGMRIAVAQMRDWVDRERAWLADHPALECYRAADARYREAIAAMAASADAFEAGADASQGPGPSGDAAGAVAAQSLQDAARGLVETAGLARTARTSCR